MTEPNPADPMNNPYTNEPQPGGNDPFGYAQGSTLQPDYAQTVPQSGYMQSAPQSDYAHGSYAQPTPQDGYAQPAAQYGNAPSYAQVPQGIPAYPAQQYGYGYQMPYQAPKWNTLAIVGFVMSFIFAIVGLICSIIGFSQTKRTGEQGKDLAFAGIIISAVSLILSVLVIILSLSLGLAIFDWASDAATTSSFIMALV